MMPAVNSSPSTLKLSCDTALDLNSPQISTPHPLSWLEQNPSLADLLLTDCNYDLEEVSEIIKPVLTAPQRCRRGLFIQAVTTGYAAFLATNLLQEQEHIAQEHIAQEHIAQEHIAQEHIAVVSPVSSSWLIGRSIVCPIQLLDRSVSRRHAVVGHSPSGFYITDLGSLNGTWINDRRLGSAERVELEDGDLVQFGTIQIEFFLSKRETTSLDAEETTYY